MKSIVRQPQQVRSIEKKNKIISASFELFSEVGYYNTNTAEIAKRAGVSTGIVYGYFQDKKDILLCVLEEYLTKVYEPILALLDNIQAPINIEQLVKTIIDMVIKTHKENANIHEALHSLSHSDEVVSNKFISFEDKITVQINEKFDHLGLNIKNGLEKIHLAMNLVQSFSHEFIYDQHSYIDYDAMQSIVFNTIINLFN